MYHDLDGGNSDHGPGDVGALLVILGQASPPSAPPEGSFHGPVNTGWDKGALAAAGDRFNGDPESLGGFG